MDRGLAFAVALVLGACGGGGGGDDGGDNGGPGGPPAGSTGSFTVAPTTLSFAAETPAAGTPAAQQVTATVSGDLSGTLYILVQVDGEAVASVSDVVITGDTTGQADVSVHAPSALGSGTFDSVMTVTACMNDPTCATGQLAGSPRTIDVSYSIGSSVQGDVVAPRVAIAATPGEVILRGRGFRSVTNVSFGSSSATFTVVGDAEIHAVHPALAAGTYGVSLDGGAVPFTGSLVVVDPPSYAATTLDYPAPLPSGALLAMVYDAERQALLLGVRQAQTGDNEVLRYAYMGAGWSGAMAAPTPELRSIAMTPDGSHILALSDNGMAELDAVTLAAADSVAGPYTDPFEIANYFLKDLAVANDGNAVVTSDIHGSGYTDTFLYSTATRTFTRASFDAMLYRGTPAVGLDGSRVVLIHGSLSPAAVVKQYDASAGRFSETPVRFNQGTAAVDRSADRIVLAGTDTTVYGAGFESLGTLAANARAVAFGPDGRRAYVFDAGNALRTFDLTSDAGGGEYPEIGSVTLQDPAVDGADRVRLVVTPDGGTAFVAGSARIVVQPLD